MNHILNSPEELAYVKIFHISNCTPHRIEFFFPFADMLTVLKRKYKNTKAILIIEEVV